MPTAIVLLISALTLGETYDAKTLRENMQKLRELGKQKLGKLGKHRR